VAAWRIAVTSLGV